jgi:hypothetical protein
MGLSPNNCFDGRKAKWHYLPIADQVGCASLHGLVCGVDMTLGTFLVPESAPGDDCLEGATVNFLLSFMHLLIQ